MNSQGQIRDYILPIEEVSFGQGSTRAPARERGRERCPKGERGAGVPHLLLPNEVRNQYSAHAGKDEEINWVRLEHGEGVAAGSADRRASAQRG